MLKDHLVKGYSINERRLKELRQSLKLVEQVLDRYDVTTDQARALLHVVADYSYALDLLDDYDHQRLKTGKTRKGKAKAITYEEAVDIKRHPAGPVEHHSGAPCIAHEPQPEGNEMPRFQSTRETFTPHPDGIEHQR